MEVNAMRQIDIGDVIIISQDEYCTEKHDTYLQAFDSMCADGVLVGSYTADKWMGYTGIKYFGIDLAIDKTEYEKHIGTHLAIPYNVIKDMLRCYVVYIVGSFIFSTINNKVDCIKYFLCTYGERSCIMQEDGAETVRDFLRFIGQQEAEIDRLFLRIRIEKCAVSKPRELSHLINYLAIEKEIQETGQHFDFEWEAEVRSRVKGKGCPYLCGKAVMVGFNDLASKYPGIAAQWHPTKNGNLTPEMVTPGRKTKVWWLYPYDDQETGQHFDFEWEAAVSSRVAGSGCPYLCGQAVWPGYNDLATKAPELAKAWHPTKNGELTPEMVGCGCTKKVWWLYPYDDPETGEHYDFEWEAKVCSRVNGTGCPYLCGKAVMVGFNDLASKYPGIAAQWHPTKNGDLSPEMVTYGAGKKVWWLFPYDDPETGKHYDFEWEATVCGRVSGKGCPYLAGQAVWPGYNDLATKEPELAKQWHPTKNGDLTPELISYCSNKKVWWLYPYDDPETGKHYEFEWEASANNRTRANGCPYLSGKAVLAGYNDLATKAPELAKEWHPTRNGDLTPEMVTCNSNKKVWWLYPYDDPETGKHYEFEWEASVSNRIKKSGCPYLAGYAVLAGFNDLESCYPEIAKEWVYERNRISPSRVYKRETRRRWWRCPVCGKVYYSSVWNRTMRKSGCCK